LICISLISLFPINILFMKSLDIIATSVNAALYAGFGYLTNLGLLTPVIGVVRFWPAVVIPAVFANIFGPVVGGVGAALGIFVSDMLLHGNALLSLLVGVPSNFVCFYIVGYIGQKKIKESFMLASVSLNAVFALFSFWLFTQGFLDSFIAYLFIGVCLLSILLVFIIGYLWPEWRSVGIASIIGLSVGSAIIGLGVWGFSYLFTSPPVEASLPFQAAVYWFIWTYATEIPFLVTLVPPILKASYMAFPRFKPTNQ
jgi:hypothetical protein